VEEMDDYPMMDDDIKERLNAILSSDVVATLTAKLIRNKFAAAALTGILSHGTHASPEEVAMTAFQYADAMLEQMPHTTWKPSKYGV